jgi:hypothetical protein
MPTEEMREQREFALEDRDGPRVQVDGAML